MNTVLSNRLWASANYLITRASNKHQSLFNGFLRLVLNIHPITRALVLIHAGCIRQAKIVIGEDGYSKGILRQILRRIDAIDLALTDWHSFVQQVHIPPRDSIPTFFTGHVLMLVNSCALFDQNGYAVRSSQIKKSLNDASVQAVFCARLGYPWDVPGRETWPTCTSVVSNEGEVCLQRDPDRLVGKVDSAYWNAYAEHIIRVVNQLSVKPTILHSHSKYSNGIAAAIAGRQLGIPVVYEMRGLWHLTRAQKEPAFYGSDFFIYEERLELWAAELAEAVVVISSTLKNWLMEHGISAAKIVVIPNAPSSLLKVSPGIQFESTQILRLAFMGSLVPYEGVGTVIEAVSLLVAKGFKISFDIFGDGDYRKVLERQVRKLKLRDHIRFHGQVSKVSILEQISKFDIFPIVRVDSEVTRLIPPLKHLEPMAAGRVVLVSALPALMKNVPDCIAAHAVPPGDSQALAEKLQFLGRNPEECARIGDLSRHWVSRNRNWVRNGQCYKELYTTIASAREHETLTPAT